MSATTTKTRVAANVWLPMKRNVQELPKHLASDFLDAYPKLDTAQAGHLRHFHNLATQKDGQWNNMGCQDAGQEWNDAYRYQLATITYAAGACHYHHTPALRSVFRTLIELLVHKMLLRDVWGYWFLTSHSGTFVDPSLKELRRPWADPVKKENIMYLGHLLLMTALHAMLFGDDKYDQPDALMIAFRYEDVRKGTNISEEVTKKYMAAWDKTGMVQDSGLFVMFFSPKQSTLMRTPSIGSTAWTSAFMNAWNPSLARITWPQTLGFLSRVEKGRVNLNSDAVALSIRNLVQKENADPEAPETIRKAREMAKTVNLPSLGVVVPTFGYVVQWASEVGDRETLNGLLDHADRFMNPTFERGGLFYSLNLEAAADDDGNYVQADTYSGNAAIGYGRLNVPDGQRKMYENPWTKEHVATVPYIDNVQLSDDVDYLRGKWDEDLKAMILTMRSWDGNQKTVEPHFCNLDPGRYGIYINGELQNIQQLNVPGDVIKVEVHVDGAGADVVLLKANV